MKRLLILLFITVAPCTGWYVASPWLAMKGLRNAASEMDREELDERVDFEAIRANMKADMNAAVDRELRDSDNVLERFGGALATGLGGMAIDAAITPSGVAALVLTGKFTTNFVPKETQGSEIEWDVDRAGLNAFEAHGRYDSGRAGPTLHFARDRIGWKLNDIDLPGGNIEIKASD